MPEVTSCDASARRRSSRPPGFTLIELSIAMIVLGLALTTTVPFLVQRLRNERIKATRTEMQAIREVLLAYYRAHLTLPAPDVQSTLPYAALGLPPSAAEDEVYAGSRYLYVMTDGGAPYSELVVDGASIGATAAVVISKGQNLRLDGENATSSDGHFAQWSSSPGFDDLVLTISASELETITAWRRKIDEDMAILNAAAALVAANDDDADGFVDEDASDPAGDWDSSSSWTALDGSGLAAVTHAGVVSQAEHLVDPWGTRYLWDVVSHKCYSAGPNRIDDGGAGDDIGP